MKNILLDTLKLTDEVQCLNRQMEKLSERTIDIDKTAGNYLKNSINPGFEPEHLLKLARQSMPFGKYKGRLLIDLPEPYVVWFAKQGFPKGELGILLACLLEIKTNGLEYLIRPLKEKR